MANQVIRWEPFGNTLSLRDAMDRLFEDSFIWPRAFLDRNISGQSNLLPMDMYETADEIVVNMVLPGVKTEDVNNQFQDGRLIIDLNVPAPQLENVTYHYRELGYGQYHREISLPVDVNTDKVEAVLERGYLTLHLPKAEAIKPKKIQIKAR
jgi:HSP20 family protein